MKEANRLGFVLGSMDTYKPYKTRSINVATSQPDLAKFAAENGSNYRMLKTLNPWLRNHSLSLRDGQSFDIQLPAN
jgi:hypothetical protein